jgi:hypothetical protein
MSNDEIGFSGAPAATGKPGIFSNLMRFGAGSMLLLTFSVAYLISGHEGIPVSIFFGIASALGMRWIVLGVVGFGRPLPPRSLSYGVAVGLGALVGLAGPTISDGYHKSNEPKRWAAVTNLSTLEEWRKNYESQVPQAYRRKEYKSRRCESVCAEALRTKNVHLMRAEVDRVFVSAAADYDDAARKTFGAAYHSLFEEGLKKIQPTSLADPKMQSAFRSVLKALEEDPSRRLMFHYEASGDLTKLAIDNTWKSTLSDPAMAKLPTLEPGDAFSPESHRRRREEVMGAIQNSLDSVFLKGLLSLEVADPKCKPDSIHFWVQAKIIRKPGFYISSNEKGVRDALLYKAEVAWKFRLTQGEKELGSFNFQSEPAKHVSYSTKPSDPKWAAYSIIMDSAADNFARLVVGRIGLEPPPVREHYTF